MARLDRKAISTPLPQLPPQPDQRQHAHRQAYQQRSDPQDPAAGPTWEIPDDVDDDHLAQMESEHRIKERGNWIWKQIGTRSNHLWDAECLQVAAATMLKIVGREAAGQEAEAGSAAE